VSIPGEELLHVERSGRGEPLLVLHGFGSSGRDSLAVVPLLVDRFEVLVADLPGVAKSPVLAHKPTVGAITDVVERTLEAQGLGTVHVLGDSLGARVGLELARRGRARSVVAISPSGANIPAERLVQGAGMALARGVGRLARPALGPLSRSPLGRTVLLAPLKTRPWAASPEQALGVQDGFADSRSYWRTLLWGLLLDVPHGLGAISCPVTLVQGTADWIASGQTPRFRLLIPDSQFRPLLAAGHAPFSDRPAAVVRLVEQAAARAAA
jgi:pimeloyl-ACP methyl ester carboxylesterase